MKKKSLVYIITSIALILLITTFIIYYFNTNNKYAVKFGDEELNKAEFSFFINQTANSMETTAGVSDENSRKEFWNSQVGGQSAKSIVVDTAIDQAKEFKIQLAEAKERGIKLDDNDMSKVNSIFDQVMEGASNEAQKDQISMENYGVKSSQYLHILKDYMLIYKFKQNYQILQNVTDAELEKYYKEKIETPDMVTVGHVLFSTIDSNNNLLSEQKIQEIKKKADDILNRAKSGEDISNLANSYSEDPGVKTNGGFYTFGKGQMVKEFETWAFGAKPGDIGLVKTQYGYHIMKKPKFEEIRSTVIKKKVLENIYSDQLKQWKNEPKFALNRNDDVINAVVLNNLK